MANVTRTRKPKRRSGSPAKLELVGLAEAADLLGVQKHTIGNYRTRLGVDEIRVGARGPAFPDPVAELRCGPIWTREQLVEWKAEHERRERLDLFEWMDERRAAQPRRRLK